MNAQLDYWRECVSEALEESAIPATPEQLTQIASFISGAHENFGLAFYSPTSDGGASEIVALKKELERERSKVVCPHCRGRGQITSYGGTLEFNSRCDRCAGTGKVEP